MNARTPTSTLKPPLTRAGYGADDGRLFGEGAFQCSPVLRPRDFEAREFVIAFGIAPFDGDGKLVARLDGFAGGLESREWQNAFGLVADVEQNRISGNGDYRTFQLAVSDIGDACVAPLELREQVAERLVAVVIRGRIRGVLFNHGSVTAS